jgi:hypothetical protein
MRRRRTRSRGASWPVMWDRVPAAAAGAAMAAEGDIMLRRSTRQ